MTKQDENNLHFQRKHAAFGHLDFIQFSSLMACSKRIYNVTSIKSEIPSRSGTHSLVRTKFPSRVMNSL